MTEHADTVPECRAATWLFGRRHERVRGERLAPLAAAAAAGLILLALLVGAWVYTARADLLSCGDHPPELTALSFAGRPDAAHALMDRWSAGCVGGNVDRQLKAALARDSLLIAAYTAALGYWLLLGAVFERRPTRRSVVQRLAGLVLVAAGADVVNSLALGRWLDRQDARGALVVAAVTAWLKWSIVLVALAFVIPIVASVVNRFVRAVVLGDGAIRPQFWSGRPALVARPVPAEKLTGDANRLAAHPASAGPRLEPAQVARFLDPAGVPWHPAGEGIGVAFSGGGIRSAAYCLGALQGLMEPATPGVTPAPGGFLARVGHLSTVSGGGFVGGAFQAMAHLLHREHAGGEAVPYGAGTPEVDHLARHSHYLWSPLPDPLPAAERWVGRAQRQAQRAERRARRHQQLCSSRDFVAALLTLELGIAFNLAVVVAVLFTVSRGLGFAASGFLFAGRAISSGVGLDWVSWLGVGAAAAAMAVAFHEPAVRWVGGWGHKGRFTRPVGDALVVFLVVLLACSLAYPMPVVVPGAFLAAGIGSLVVALLVLKRAPRGRRAADWILKVVPGLCLAVGALWLAVHWYLEARNGGWNQAQSVRLLARWVIAAAGGLLGAVLAAAVTRLVIARFRRTSSAAPFGRQTAALAGSGLAGGALSVIVLGRGLSRVGPGWGQARSGVIWLVVAALLAVTYLGADQKMWSPHPLYKRRLAGCFALYRPSAVAVGPSQDGETGNVAVVPYRVPTTLSEWARPVPGFPEHLISAAVYDSFQAQAGVAAHSFVFSSSFVGGPDIGWMRTADFEAALGRRNAGDATLLGAMAISGAAVSPAVGAIDAGSAAALISLFNGRLGVWLPSPTYVEELSDPARSSEGHYPLWIKTRRLTYLLRELTSRYDTRDRFVYVTDGGQFDNLGVYPLLERRCRTIVAFDASGDLRPGPAGQPPTCAALHTLRDLAWDKLRVNLISLDDEVCHQEEVSPAPAECPPCGCGRRPEARCVGLGQLGRAGTKPLREGRQLPVVVNGLSRFRIRYPAIGDEGPVDGLLIVAKAVISDTTGPELRTYATANHRFPADSTLDQFLDPDRFEQYVALGRENATAALRLLSPGSEPPTGPTGRSPGNGPDGQCPAAPAECPAREAPVTVTWMTGPTPASNQPEPSRP